MLNHKVWTQKDAKSLMLQLKELWVEEEEPTEHTVESHHIFHQTLIWSSTLLKRVLQLKEKTKNKLDWQRNKLLNKDSLLESDHFPKFIIHSKTCYFEIIYECIRT